MCTAYAVEFVESFSTAIMAGIVDNYLPKWQSVYFFYILYDTIWSFYMIKYIIVQKMYKFLTKKTLLPATYPQLRKVDSNGNGIMYSKY